MRCSRWSTRWVSPGALAARNSELLGSEQRRRSSFTLVGADDEPLVVLAGFLTRAATRCTFQLTHIYRHLSS